MTALFKREFRSYFQGVRGYLFVSLFLVFLGIFVTLYNFAYANTSIAYALYDMIPILALITPILTVNVFSEERKSGAYRLIYSLPIKNSHIVIAKYLALVAVFAIPFSFSAALPLVFNFFAEIDFIQSYTALLALFLLEAALIAVLVFIASLSDNRWVSLSVSYGTVIVLYFANILRLSFANGYLLRALSVVTFFGDFEGIIYGTFDILTVIYYLSVIAVLLTLSVFALKKRRFGGDRTKKSSFGWISVLLVGAVLMLNVSSVFLPRGYTEADITANDMHTVSRETEKLLDSIDSEVVFYLLNSDGSNKKFETFLRRYTECGKTLRLEYIDTSAETDFLSSRGYSADSEIPPYTLLIESGERSRVLSFYDMISYINDTFGELSYSEYYYYHALFSSNESYADYLDKLVYYSQMNFNGEAVISGAVEYVALDMVKYPYLITGRGEDNAALLTILNVPSCDVSSVDAIPTDSDFIIISEPSEDYQEGERDMILEYLKSGGRMLLITNEENLSMPNLMSIAEYYGMRGEAIDGEVREMSARINTDHDIFAALGDSSDITMLNPSNIEISKELRSAQLVTPILTAAPEAEGETISYNLGVAVEEETSNGTTKLVWFTGADSFSSADSEQSALNLAVYAMGWMSAPYVSALGNIAPTLYEGLPMDVTADGVLWFGIVTIALIPAAVFAGGWIYLKKRNKA